MCPCIIIWRCVFKSSSSEAFEWDGEKKRVMRTRSGWLRSTRTSMLWIFFTASESVWDEKQMGRAHRDLGLVAQISCRHILDSEQALTRCLSSTDTLNLFWVLRFCKSRTKRSGCQQRPGYSRVWRELHNSTHSVDNVSTHANSIEPNSWLFSHVLHVFLFPHDLKKNNNLF